jgi:hypothetical protein
LSGFHDFFVVRFFVLPVPGRRVMMTPMFAAWSRPTFEVEEATDQAQEEQEQANLEEKADTPPEGEEPHAWPTMPAGVRVRGIRGGRWSPVFTGGRLPASKVAL